MSAVTLVEHRERWVADFLTVQAELTALFYPVHVEVQHVGSTAVPGLCAKPVLDLLLGVTALPEIEAQIPALATAGFRHRREYEKQIPERRYFVREAGLLPRIHLHAVVAGGAYWREHLAFRDALRADPMLRERYSSLKRALAARHVTDKAAYTEGKAPFIAAVLADLRCGPPASH
jgi:GrpB-like predicted nucleotidyltransferase (UPF0157 family)